MTANLHPRFAARLLIASALVVTASGPLEPLNLTAGGQAPERRSRPDPATRVDESVLAGLQWRAIGPAAFGGRVSDVAGVPGNANTLYVAFASAGLYKSTNGGVSFESIFDQGNTLSIGTVGIAADNPDVVYVGTGEGKPRNSASFGDGIYRSLDGGRTWTHLGLARTERFSRLIIHPQNSDIVYAAAMGHEWGANEERGVYKSTDAGRSWRRVLFVNPTTGASDLAIDPQNPNILYAGMYDYLRQAWHFRSGGQGSGLYRSADGGESWARLTDPALDNGLPQGLLGRIAVAVSRSRPQVVYTLIEAEAGGVLWRSDDRGERWRLINSNRAINARPFYFSGLRVDPIDENRLFSFSRSLYVSNDGGRSFSSIDYWRMFGDFHALWIDPVNPSRILAGSDGGFFISNDRGERWDFLNKIPAAQVYRFAVDTSEPYNIVGGFQDHEVWRGPNELWNVVGVRNGDWRRLRAHGDGASVVVDPRDPNIIYYSTEHGDITRVDLRTAEERYIQPYPVAATGVAASQELYRFNWIAPIVMSRTNPDVIYLGGNVLFRTANGGSTWRVISPDLTTNDPEKQKLSGGITPDNTRAEAHCTISAVAESPRDPNVIWVGTDDGNVQITRDAGTSWTNVVGSITGAPRQPYVSFIQASSVDSSTAYLAIDQHRMDDFASYAFVTTDYGKTWRDISKGLRGYVHVVLEDPKQPALLYAGTELGVFASFDRGATWTDLRLGLPPLSVMDIKVHPRDDDLVIGTHARGFFVLDDVTPLRELAAARQQTIALFTPKPATRYTPASDTSSLGGGVFVAPNKAYGAQLSYFLARPPENAGSVEITILDPQGKAIRTLAAGRRAGVNRTVWDLRAAGCAPPQGAGAGVRGARVLPGRYVARLTALGQTVERAVVVRADPRIAVPEEELMAHAEAVGRLVPMECAVARALEQIAGVEQQLGGLEKHVPERTLGEHAAALRRELEAIRDRFESDPRGPEPLNLSRKISKLREEIEGYTGRPTPAQAEWIAKFGQQLDQMLQALDRAFAGSLARLNEHLSRSGIPHVVVDRGKQEDQGRPPRFR